MKKSVVVAPQNGTYSLVIRVWEEDENGLPINENSLTEINLTWEQVVEKINSL
jgi:hypothetical protein